VWALVELGADAFWGNEATAPSGIRWGDGGDMPPPRSRSAEVQRTAAAFERCERQSAAAAPVARVIVPNPNQLRHAPRTSARGASLEHSRASMQIHAQRVSLQIRAPAVPGDPRSECAHAHCVRVRVTAKRAR
jgi:hypothetical protein